MCQVFVFFLIFFNFLHKSLYYNELKLIKYFCLAKETKNKKFNTNQIISKFYSKNAYLYQKETVWCVILIQLCKKYSIF